MAVGTPHATLSADCSFDNECPCVWVNHIFDQFLAQMVTSASVLTNEPEPGPNGMATIHKIL
jgi:hypothetical protein